MSLRTNPDDDSYPWNPRLWPEWRRLDIHSGSLVPAPSAAELADRRAPTSASVGKENTVAENIWSARALSLSLLEISVSN
jgi:hypothetical protein